MGNTQQRPVDGGSMHVDPKRTQPSRGEAAALYRYYGGEEHR